MSITVKQGDYYCPTWKGLLIVVLVCIGLVGSFISGSIYMDRNDRVIKIKALEARIDLRLEDQRQTIVNLLIRLEDRVDLLTVEISKLND